MSTPIEIKSKDNEKIKNLRKLQQKKYRTKLKSFCVENLVIIHDALQAGINFESLFITEDLIKQKKPKLEYILKNIKNYFLINTPINNSFSSLDTPSGICAIYKKKKSKKILAGKILYLNALKDPGNLGTILRTALAFNFKDIVIDEHCTDLYNPKTISSAKDAIFKLNINFDNKLQLLNKLKDDHKLLVSDVSKGNDVSSIKANKYCIILGNEARGVNSQIREIDHKKVHIKMPGNVESLNVATAAAIILYELEK